jgi:hypothetical protein
MTFDYLVSLRVIGHIGRKILLLGKEPSNHITAKLFLLALKSFKANNSRLL